MFIKRQPCGREHARYCGSKESRDAFSSTESRSSGTPTVTSNSADLHLSTHVGGSHGGWNPRVFLSPEGTVHGYRLHVWFILQRRPSIWLGATVMDVIDWPPRKIWSSAFLNSYNPGKMGKPQGRDGTKLNLGGGWQIRARAGGGKKCFVEETHSEWVPEG